MIPRLKKIYQEEFIPALKQNLGIQNVMQVPKIEKIVLNMGLGLDASDSKILKAIQTDLANLTGQQPTLTKSKKAVANFKTRKDIPMGLKVTLRKNNMYCLLYPEVNFDKIEKMRGMDITVVTSTSDKNQARALLDSFQFPFYKKGSN
ncbi:MAG: 50S ribosomal protein L5 [Pelagibacteraceae bacterium]|nr:50S ribosomal protein L5 [Pelagibacteraceae bacterium]